jgi:hypothetical protein
MNFYLTESIDSTSPSMYEQLDTSASNASKTRTGLKKAGHTNITTIEVDVTPTRNGIMEFYNERHAYFTPSV